jgi:hypothetical protein
MSSVQTSSERATGSPPVKAGQVRLEVVILPVSDVDRAKCFYETLGWRLDADLAVDDGYRVVPPRRDRGGAKAGGRGTTHGSLTEEEAMTTETGARPTQREPRLLGYTVLVIGDSAVISSATASASGWRQPEPQEPRVPTSS